MASDCDQVEMAETVLLGEEVPPEAAPGWLLSPGADICCAVNVSQYRILGAGQHWLQSAAGGGQSSVAGRHCSVPTIQVTHHTMMTPCGDQVTAQGQCETRCEWSGPAGQTWHRSPGARGRGGHHPGVLCQQGEGAGVAGGLPGPGEQVVSAGSVAGE